MTALGQLRAQGFLVERGRRGLQVAAVGDAAATLQADIDCHSFIYEASGNPLIVQSMQAHWQHLRRAMSEVLKRPRFTQKVWREHAAIVDALGRGDSAAASRLIADHVNEAHWRVGGELGAPARSA
jgi:DNA-binding FadR family transcriptional regulator